MEKMEGFSTGQDDSPGHSNGPVTFWEVMTRKGSIVFFLLFLPILWTVFIGVGWSMDDKVEERVFNIWTRQRSDFAKDIEYSAKYDRDAFPLTSFAAMAISRDGTNLFTKERLEEIRTRMEEAESTTVSSMATLQDTKEIGKGTFLTLRVFYSLSLLAPEGGIQWKRLHLG